MKKVKMVYLGAKVGKWLFKKAKTCLVKLWHSFQYRKERKARGYEYQRTELNTEQEVFGMFRGIEQVADEKDPVQFDGNIEFLIKQSNR